MAEKLDFLNGVKKLHGFYTENVKMLAGAYGLSDEEAARLLDNFGYFNVAREILKDRTDDEEPETVAEFNTDERQKQGYGGVL